MARSQQQCAATGLQILTLLKRFASQAFSGVVLHGTEEDADAGAPTPAPAVSSYGPLRALEVGPWGVRVRFRVPPHLCSGGDGYLTCGAVMAWFDEVSSWAFICGHARHRPGVSVSLTATVSRWAKAGQAVVLESRALKAGDTLGFADVILRDAETGHELAHGRHVKFLKMGRGWDLAMHPLVFPLARYLARRACDRAAALGASPFLLEGRRGGGSQQDKAAASPPAATPPLDLDDILGLEGFTFTDDGSTAAAHHHHHPRPPTIFKATARLRVLPRLCNNYGTLHGGAVAILAERMAARVWGGAARMAGVGEELLWPHARACSIDYMSPAPKGSEVVLEAWATPLGPAPPPSPWPTPTMTGPLRHPTAAAAADGDSSEGGDGGGSWLPTPGLVRVWFRCGSRILTQCHVQIDDPPSPPATLQPPQPQGRQSRL